VISLKLLAVFSSYTAASVLAAPISLTIGQSGRSVVVSWPTNAVGYNLQFRSSLEASNAWFIAFPPGTNTRSANVFSNLAPIGSQFYRLQQFGSTPPVLTNLIGPGALPYNATGALSFSFADPDGDIAALQVTRSNIFGVETSTVPAYVLGIVGTNGTVSLPATADGLPFGTSSFSLQLIDSQGHRSHVVPFTLQATGVWSNRSNGSIGKHLQGEQNVAYGPMRWFNLSR